MGTRLASVVICPGILLHELQSTLLLIYIIVVCALAVKIVTVCGKQILQTVLCVNGT